MHPNERLARKEIELINAGDLGALNEMYADDLILHYPGRNPLAGDYEKRR
jgi:ketosteroid isomerase-like protein